MDFYIIVNTHTKETLIFTFSLGVSQRNPSFLTKVKGIGCLEKAISLYIWSEWIDLSKFFCLIGGIYGINLFSFQNYRSKVS